MDEFMLLNADIKKKNSSRFHDRWIRSLTKNHGD